MESEESLARRARGGDRAAFEELVRRTCRLIHARMYLETGSPHEAEDLVQETYLRAFRSIRGLKDPQEFRRWLLAVSQSALIDSFRRAARARRKAPPREGQEVLENVAAPPGDAGVSDRRDMVRAVLRSLPEEYRLPLTLRYVAGADYDTITMQLGLGPGALRGLLYRGLQLLRRAVRSEVLHESR